MAFECIDKYTQVIFDKLDKIKKKANSSDFIVNSTKEDRASVYNKENELMWCAMEYYTIVLITGKFRSQRAYFKYRLKQYNPDFYQGYFNEKKRV
jgi:hypothetical protein